VSLTAPPIYIQLGLFGGYAEVAGTHVVAAHTRLLSDGSEVFVSEHLRWNQGRQHRGPPSVRRAPPPGDDHPSLFDRPPPPTPERQPSHGCGPRNAPRMEEIEVFPGAFQLPLWGA
jgi:hypothetical protein